MAGVDDSQRSGSAMTPGPMDTSADEGIRTAQFAERNNWIQFLEDQFVQSTQTDGAKLTKTMKAMAQMLSSKSSSIFGARPFLSIIPSPYFKVAFCGLVLLYGSLTFFASFSYVHGGINKGRAFNFKVLQLRNSSLPPTQYQLPLIGVRKGSCKRTEGSRTAVADSVSITFEEEVAIDGWFFALGEDPARDPVKFSITIDSGEAQEWMLEQPLWWTGRLSPYARPPPCPVLT